MKKPHRSSFKFSPVATAVAVALSSQFAVNVAQAGAGFGSGVTTANAPVAVPTFYANSPAGPAPTFDMATGKMTISPVTALPNPINTGKALRKFVDALPTIPSAVAEKWVDLNGVPTNDDYYEIAAIEYTQQMHSDLVKPTRLRGYVQLMTPGLLAAGKTAVSFTTADGQVLSVVAAPHHLGPIINATKGTAIRVKFTNLLPAGNLFLPVDTTITGAAAPYTQNRANIHLVGGEAPWISAGTPHQWVAPASEVAAYAAGLGKGASVKNVPDMADPGPGSSTLYFPNDLSARFTFIQDRTSGLTRLNSYAGLEAGYVISDDAEKKLITDGVIPGAADTIPLIIEDKTFVPENVAQQDSKWAWGQPGDLWFPHVYEPNQDPLSISGANPVGRWDYGPLFWPIFPSLRGALPTVSATPEAYLDTPVINGVAYPTLTVDPKAYRMRILNASNDRYINLGLYKADGTITAPQLDKNGNPIVDASGNQQFFTNTEVKMVPAAPIDALGNPPGWDVVNNVQLPLPQFLDAAGAPVLPWHINAEQSGPTRAWAKDGRAGGAPDPTMSGPDFVVIGNDGGLIPHPVDIPSQPVTYETNRRSITVLSIYGYGMLLGPAERADTVVDFSKYAGQTLILYNDAPAPAPFIDPRNDYYTGNPDLSSQGGAYSTQPGYGPNTRTMMQIVVKAASPAVAATATTPAIPAVVVAAPYDAAALVTALPAAYALSNPPIVPAVAYNAAFGTNDVDVVAHVATGSSAQPTLDYTTSGQMNITGLNLVTSGGTAPFGGVVVGNPIPGSGSGYKSAPLVTISPPNLPGGIQATATATITASTQQVTGIALTNAGSGYTAAPTVTFTPTSIVSGVVVAAGGSGYSAPVVTVEPPQQAGGKTATATASVAGSGSSILSTATLGTGGSGYTIAPSVSIVPVAGDPGTGATAFATIATSPVKLGLTSGGSGYSAPTVTISAPQTVGIQATATPIMSWSISPSFKLVPNSATDPTSGFGYNPATTVVSFGGGGGLNAAATAILDPVTGAVTGITLTNKGTGYTSAPTIVITDILNNNSATATASLDSVSGVITGFNLSPGTGYTLPPTVKITDATGSGAIVAPALANAAGMVNNVTVTNVGKGYLVAPTVKIIDSLGTATTPATATVALASGAVNVISAITITDPGSGYTSAPKITITDSSGGTGTGASAIAAITASGVGAQASVVTSNTKSITVQTKAEQELFDDYGRYNSTGGVEIPLVNGVVQTTIPLNYIDSATEIINDKTLKNENVQVWKLVDNGFWSNSVHFDMVDVQLINRVGWDGTVKPPASNELGWKDTLRLNPLEDVIIAMRAKVATVPFGQPKSSRLLDPSKPVDSTGLAASGLGFTGAQAAGLAIGVATKNEVREFDHEFTWGSAILGHADNDFRRPVIFNPTVEIPDAPTNLVDPLGTGVTLSWTDTTPSPTALAPNAATLANPKNELGFKVVKALAPGGVFVAGTFDLAHPVASLPANATTWTEAPTALANVAYAVVAYNVAGDSAVSNAVINAAPLAPTGLSYTTAFITPATTTTDVAVTLTWTDNAINETSYEIVRGNVVIATLPANATPSLMTYKDSTAVEGVTYVYTVRAKNLFGPSGPSNSVSVLAPISVPLAPTGLGASYLAATGRPADVVLTWTDAAFNEATSAGPVAETSYTISRTGGAAFTPVNLTGGNFASALAPNARLSGLTYTDTTALEGVTYVYTVSANNLDITGTIVQTGSASLAVTSPITIPVTPTGLTATPSTAVDPYNGVYVDTVTLSWTDNAFNETGYQILRNNVVVKTVPANTNPIGGTITAIDTGLLDGLTYSYTVAAYNSAGSATSTPAVNAIMPGEIIPAPTGFTATPNRAASSISLRWIDNATTETDYLVEQSTDGGVTWSILQPPVARTALQGTQTGGTVTHARTAALLGATYTFRVSARNLPKFSDSPYATATVNLTGPAAPIAPTLAVPTVNAVSGRVALTWGAVAPVAGTTISYIVNVTVNGTTTAIPTNRASYTYRPTAAQLRTGLTLSFSVQAVATSTIRGVAGLPTGTNTGPASAVQTVNYSTLPAPTAPATFTATTTRLTWTAATGLATGATVSYAVEQSADGGLTWAAITGSPFAASPVTFTSAVGNNYLYRVQATASRAGALSSVSAWRQSAAVNTLPAVSTTPVAAAGVVGSKSIVVAWTNLSTNITGFTIQRRLGTGAWTTINPAPTVTKSGTTYSITDTVAAAGSYTYRLLARSLGGSTVNTAASNAVIAP